jgi:hypothetical protein
MSVLLAGLALGFMGSLHCLGMCGPLVLALPGGSATGARYVTGRVFYNAGRVLTYALLGGLLGGVGGMFRMSGLQQWLSIGVGVLVLAGVLFPAAFSGWLGRIPAYAALERGLRRSIGALFSRNSLPVLLLIGILNGFLPCGFVYIALGAAATVGDPGGAATFMAGFGAGTLPVMLGVSLFGARIGNTFRGKLSRAVPVMVAIVAVLLILRGLNLGIPYVSPKIVAESEEVDCCH